MSADVAHAQAGHRVVKGAYMSGQLGRWDPPAWKGLGGAERLSA